MGWSMPDLALFERLMHDEIRPHFLNAATHREEISIRREFPSAEEVMQSIEEHLLGRDRDHEEAVREARSSAACLGVCLGAITTLCVVVAVLGLVELALKWWMR
jgi:hypothetical protein